ncbi:nicotinamide riboside transporter PnuC [Sphingobium sp. HBC34]|uniref:Nicotinamide riboside transporter PnuC n=1 Tax=Sphingobium cyanobacteriorum TaxID=3063954 RepID=A0ABT8ZNW2_9SPHN|nr:nicotinamide riboside transporter PnuC [Sphingobium sp. HBC34]MDO7836224.1 nicotinamide riboside transporter PnuC [Sphingobium sp. HBC34]
MNMVEWGAAALGLVNIVLVARRSLWNYPFGIAMVALYFFVFVEAKLYSDALLQIFFLVINLYGWWNWMRSDRIADGGVAVGRLDHRARLLWLAGTAVAALAWGAMMARFTDAAAPFADASIAGMSVAAQILQSQRKYESWVLWIAVDALATGLFWSRGLVATAILYAIFFGVALCGLVAWRRTMAQAAA